MASTRLVNDFSRIPLFGKTHRKIQPKLTVSTPGDIYEQEADEIADNVMHPSEMQLQRACKCGGGCSENQSEQSDKEHDHVQTKQIASADLGQPTIQPIAPIVKDAISSPGRPLDSATRGFMESRLGYDFSQVRVHLDPQANDAANAVQARAFTLGHDIVFGANQFEPTSANGRRLLAHELVHVIQQRSTTPLSVGHRHSIQQQPIGGMIQRQGL
ncbi:MAG: DUF4157 domain-containing protein, partial [Leptolyngbya sp. SIO1D8]|nr:DUF4157 domain-containing protein [Leptolyngbya sp. SIO1D8]